MMIPNQHDSGSPLPPSVPPHLLSAAHPPSPPPLAEFAEPDYSIEPLNESSKSLTGIIVIGIATIVWYVIAIQQIMQSGGPTNQLARIAFEVLVMVGGGTFCAWIPLLMGLGTLRVWMRYAIGSAASIPPVLILFASISHPPSAKILELVLRVIVWLATVSSIFWFFRLFRWRITQAQKLILPSKVGKGEEILIPLNQRADEVSGLVRWYLYLRNSPHKFLDRFRPDQFNIRQIMLVTFFIAAFLTVAKLMDRWIEIFSFQRQPIIQVIFPLSVYAFATLIVAWSILRPQKFLRYYFACSLIIFCTIFIIVFFVTTRGIVNLEADFYQTLQIGSVVEFVFSFGCTWFMILRCLGFRFIRLAPSGFSTENLDEVEKPF